MKDKQLLEQFREYLVSDGKGTATVKSYMVDIRGFLHWLKNKGVVFDGNLTRFYVTSYRSHILEENYTVNTINKKVNSLHSFNHYLIASKLCSEKAVYPNKDKIKIAAGSEGEVDVLTDSEVEKLLFYIENREQVSQRDRTAILILLYTGIRVSELVSLKIQDIDLITFNLKVIGKGGKYREVPLKAEVAKAIQEYLGAERKDSSFSESEYLLVTQRAGKMDRDTVNKLLKKHAKYLDMRLKPHKFRHTFCTKLINKKVDLVTVAKLAGHANIQTTSRFYVNTSREDKQNAVNLL